MEQILISSKQNPRKFSPNGSFSAWIRLGVQHQASVKSKKQFDSFVNLKLQV
jgi:hypothetical protein